MEIRISTEHVITSAIIICGIIWAVLCVLYTQVMSGIVLVGALVAFGVGIYWLIYKQVQYYLERKDTGGIDNPNGF